MDIRTPSTGGEQKTFCINLDVLTLWLGSISASRVKPEIQDTLVRYQRECMAVLRQHFFGPKEEPAPAPPITTAQQALLHAQALVELEQKQMRLREEQEEQRTRLQTVEERLDAKDAIEQEASRGLLALPGPKDLPIPRTIRSLLVERMRAVANARSGNHRDFWNELYREYLYRSRIDLKRRAKNRNKKPIDMAEEMGVLAKLYDLCCHLWPTHLDDLNSNVSNGIPHDSTRLLH